ncbi:MAG: hypothetical protein QOD99_1563, partial [Chthoniobacter sp.]|nr:hypothetical protein [Chthoniobacter sp.]
MNTTSSVIVSRCAGLASAFVSIVLLAFPTVQAATHVLQFTAGAADAPITSSSITLDSPVLNGKGTLKPIVTQYLTSIYNNHPVGVYYSAAISPAPASTGRWLILNEDGAAMPSGAKFNVLVPTAAKKVNASPSNSSIADTFILPGKGKPDAILLFSHMID